MFTGRRPTDDIFEDGLTLHDFVKSSLPERVREVMDLHLVLGDEKETAKWRSTWSQYWELASHVPLNLQGTEWRWGMESTNCTQSRTSSWRRQSKKEGRGLIAKGKACLTFSNAHSVNRPKAARAKYMFFFFPIFSQIYSNWSSALKFMIFS